MPNTYYKVVSETPEDGVYEPAFMPVMGDGALHITYKQGKTTKPPEGWGPLAAFRSLPAAIDFIQGSGLRHLTILKGTGEPSHHDLLWYRDPYGSGSRITRYVVPFGTVFLDEFTPTEEVSHHA